VDLDDALAQAHHDGKRPKRKKGRVQRLEAVFLFVPIMLRCVGR
jgi:hypothetical protein